MASSKIKGITIDFGGTTTKLGQALDNITKESREVQKELKGVNTLLKFDPSNVELLRQKQELLVKSIQETSEKQNILNETLKKYKSGEISLQADEYRDLQREIVATKKQLSGLQEEMKNFGSVTEQRINQVNSKIQSFADSIDKASDKLKVVSAAAVAGLSASIVTAASLEDATRQYLATTGKSIEEAEKYQAVLQNIHDSNYGEGYADIADKMRLVSNIMGDLPVDQLQSIVENSYMLEDAYGMDFQETIRGVNGLVTNMKVSYEEAFDLITKGAQNGLNMSNELGDNLAEYTQIWGQAGFTAQEMFGILENGLNAGAYNLDKVNDFVKEFTISLSDGRIKENIKSFSKDTQQLFKEWEKGEKTSADVFTAIVNDLKNTEDQQKALTLASNIWSALGEDNAMKVITSLTDVNNSYQDTTGTIENATEMMYSGTQQKAEEAVRKLKSSFADLTKNLLPLFTKIIDKVSEWIDAFNGLDENTKNIITSVALLTAGLSTGVKIFGKVVSSVTSVNKIIGKLVSVLSSSKKATDAATASQLKSNAALLANPYTLVIAGVTGLVAALVALNNASSESVKKMEEETAKIKEQTDAVNETAQAFRDNVAAKQEALNQSLEELSYYESLYNELQTIVDANGKVKESYESRADFIVTTLSEALGMEISLVDNQITNYNELTETFDKVMEKKKAMLTLESQEEAYQEAIKNRTAEMEAANEAQLKMAQIEEEYNRKHQEYLDKYMSSWQWENSAREKELEELRKQYAEYSEQYNTHSELYEDYLNTIGMYEENYQLMHEERYSEMMATEEEYLVRQATNGKTSIENIQELISQTEENLNYLKELKEQNNTDMYNAEIEAQEKQLEVLQSALETQKNTIANGNQGITDTWLNGMANLISSIDGKKYEFQRLGNDTIQLYIDGVKNGEPVANENMKVFVSNLINQIYQQNPNAKSAGENLLDGFLNGISNVTKQNNILGKVSSFASNILNRFKSALDEHSPSKATEEAAEFFTAGFDNGIEKSKEKTLKNISSFGKNVLNSFQNQLSDGFQIDTNINTTRKMMMDTLISNSSKMSLDATAKDTKKLNSLLEKYMPIIADNLEKYIVLDDGTLVGKLAPQIDSSLGSISSKRKRGR